MTPENGGGADYEAKACLLMLELHDEFHENDVRIITAALAKSAADERERCEAIARGFEEPEDNLTPYGHRAVNRIAEALAAAGNGNGGATERKLTIKECADFLLAEAQCEGDDAVRYTLKRAAENIIALAETKGGGK